MKMILTLSGGALVGREWLGAICFAFLSLMGFLFHDPFFYAQNIFPALLVICFTLTSLYSSRRATGILLALASGFVPAYVVIFQLDPNVMIFQYTAIICLFGVVEYRKWHHKSDIEFFLESIRSSGEANNEREACLPAIDLVKKMFPDSMTGVALYESRANRFRVISTPHYEIDFPSFKAEEGSISWRAYSTGEPQIIDDVTKDPDYVKGFKNARSEVTLLISSAERKFGVLNVESAKKARFSRRDVQNLSVLAALLGETFAKLESRRQIENNMNALRSTRLALSEALEESFVRRSEQEDLLSKLRSLFRITEELSLCLFSEGLYQKMVELLEENMKYDNIYIFGRFSPEQDLDYFVRAGVSDHYENDEDLSLYKKISESVIEQGVPWFYPDNYKQIPGVDLSCQKGSVIVLPVSSPDTSWGAIVVQNNEGTEDSSLTSRDLEVLTIASSHLALQIETLNAVGNLNLQVSRLKGLHRIVQTISGRKESREDLCNRLVRELQSQYGYEEIILYLSKNQKDDLFLEPVASRNIPGEKLEEFGQDLYQSGKGLVYSSARERKLLNTKDVRVSENYYRSGYVDTISEVDVPIIFKERLYGVICVEAMTPFNKQDEEFFMIIASHLGAFLAINEVIDETEKKALVDDLTGLWNRRYLFMRVDQEGSRLKRYGGSVSILMIDMTNFKYVNDKYGHVKGDEVLQTFGGFLRQCIRKSDEVGRYGGDEFLVLMPGATREDVKCVVERINRECEDIHLAGVPSSVFNADVGMCCCPEDTIDMLEAVRIADQNMYEAKMARKSRGEKDYIQVKTLNE